MNRINLLLALLAVTVLSESPADAQAQNPSAQYMPADQIAAAVAAPTTNAIAQQMGGDPSTVVWSIKREKSGEVELHGAWNDVIIAKAGSIIVTVGEKVEGNRLFKPNEWLGGKIVDGRQFVLKPGDILFIPAGLGHQMTLPGKGPFTYLVIKTAAQAIKSP